MTWTRGGRSSKTRRLAVVDAYNFPSSVRQRFAAEHRDLSAVQITLVEAATRQWFRLGVRRPKATLSMPSVVVDDLWHELVLHTRDYAQFCEAAFGRFLHHMPESAMDPAAAAANRSSQLAATLRLAQQDEGCRADALPLLFRVDQELDVAQRRRYLADCGGRGQCYEDRNMVCLQHLGGVGKPTRGNWDRDRAPSIDMPTPGGGDVGCASQ